MKVYVVTREHYSEHDVLGVFTTERDALACARTSEENDSGYYYEVKPHQVDEPQAPYPGLEIGPIFGARAYFVTGTISGTYTQCNKWLRHPTECEIAIEQDYIHVVSPISQEHAKQVALAEYEKRTS